MSRELDFRECGSCHAQAGSPTTLCFACQHNRKVISVLQEKLREARLVPAVEARVRMVVEGRVMGIDSVTDGGPYLRVRFAASVNGPGRSPAWVREIWVRPEQVEVVG